jgi:PIN domain nuclease of toxin-antitoxin system
MSILLDCRTLLGWAGEPERFTPSARNVIGETANEIYASAVSPWELGPKVSKGK